MSSNRSSALVTAALVLAGFPAGPPAAAGQAAEDRSILRVMDRARSALLAGRGREVCSLLTAHGRRRVMAFRVDYDNYGQIPPEDPRLPQTCRGMVRRQWNDADDPRGGVSWSRDLRRSTFRVLRIGRRGVAVARLTVQKPYSPTADFRLRRTKAGWRIADSDAVPAGH